MEILATIPVYTHSWIYHLFMGIAVLFVIVGLGFAISSIEFQTRITLVIGVVLMAIGILGFFLTNRVIDNASTFDYNKYKVIIDETISAKDFLNKYEVLSKEGEIFTVREIESSKNAED